MRLRRGHLVPAVGLVMLAAVTMTVWNALPPASPTDRADDSTVRPDPEPGAAPSCAKPALADAEPTAKEPDDSARDAPPDIVVLPSEAEVEAYRPWAESSFMQPGQQVKPDRYRYVKIDWYTFTRQLQSSPAYLAAASGRLPLPIEQSAPPDLTMSLFPDLTVGLRIHEVRLSQTNNRQYAHFDGEIVSGGSGDFLLSTDLNQNTFRGEISLNNNDRYIRLETPKDAEVTAIAEFGREFLELSRPID